MSNQTILQIRVDNDLKAQASEVFEQLGIDIPTAVRMFFKAVIREQGLPFETKVRNNTMESEQFMTFMKNFVMYQPPLSSDEDTIAVLPLESDGAIPPAMYVQLVTKVPAGKITSWEDIFATLGHLYGREVKNLPDRTLPYMDEKTDLIPYWRIVSSQGVLMDGKGGTRAHQKEELLNEGIPVVQRGSRAGSYEVDNYKDYMFDFSKLKIVQEG